MTELAIDGLPVDEIETAVRTVLLSADVVAVNWTTLSEVLGSHGIGARSIVAVWAEAHFPGRWGFRDDLLVIDRAVLS